MALELVVFYPGDASTIYAVIRKASDATVFNGTTFETWANGSIGNYDIPLTAYSGDMYAATMPTAVTAANLIVSYYLQAGGSPAITDTKLAQVDHFYWNGTAASSAASVSLSAYALATLAQVKQDLAITDSASDTAITEFINQMTALIERVCGIHFISRDYRHRFNGVNQKKLRLPERPINTITRIAYGSAQAMSVSFTGSAIRADIAITDTGVRLNSIGSTGTATSNHLLFATYGSVSSMVTAIAAVTGWTATTITNVPSVDLNRTGGQNALAKTVYAEYPDQSDVEYTVDYDLGIVSFSRFGSWFWPSISGGGRVQLDYGWKNDARMPRGFQHIIVEYNAGYATAPDDVNALCRDLIRERHYEYEIGPGVTSIALGPFSTTFTRKAEETIRERMAHYMDAGVFVGGVS